ncbi:hypothetical protein BHE74_00049294 [Ensete ventricosum]|nr:hypothetical protein BHE74_00049294 [Ensete ventricosum]RZR94127.1 hypothetical protein BHM03_00022754 [Ensete ventricosum]
MSDSLADLGGSTVESDQISGYGQFNRPIWAVQLRDPLLQPQPWPFTTVMQSSASSDTNLYHSAVVAVVAVLGRTQQ